MFQAVVNYNLGSVARKRVLEDRRVVRIQLAEAGVEVTGVDKKR